ARAHGGEARAVGLHQRVAAHARLGGGDHRVGRPLDVGVAIATIHAERPGVQLVAVGYRLLGRVADLQILRREVVPKDEYDAHERADSGYGGDEGELVERP